MATLIGSDTSSYATLSVHSLEAHRRLYLSNDKNDGAAGYQTAANKASINVSSGTGTAEADFAEAIGMYHDGSRCNVNIEGAVACPHSVDVGAGSFVANAEGATVTDLTVSGVLNADQLALRTVLAIGAVFGIVK